VLWAGRVRDLTRACPRSSTHLSERAVAAHWVLETLREIDEVPMRWGYVAAVAAWAWGSHRACVLGARDLLACPHAAYLALARGRGDRRRHYARLGTTGDAPQDIALDSAQDISMRPSRTATHRLARVSSPHPGHAYPPA